MLVLLSLIAPSLAATITVDAAGTADHTSIQAGMDAAVDGDVVSIAAGTYSECINYWGKDIAVIGAGSGDVTINGGCDDAVTVEGSTDASLSGVTVNNAGNRAVYAESSVFAIYDVVVTGAGLDTDDGNGLYQDGGIVTISGSSFSDLVSARGGAVFVTGAGELIVSSSTFSGNSAESEGGAIFLDSRASLSVESSDFDRNQGSSGGAIHGDADNPVMVADSQFTRNLAEGEVGGGAIYIDHNGNLDISGSSFRGNTAAEGPGGDVSVTDYSSLDVDTSDFFEGLSGGGDGGGAIHVDNLRNEVTITDSTFTDTTARTWGGGAISVNTMTDLVLDNVDISGAFADGAGGAVYLYDRGSITVTDSSFEDNVSDRGHAGAIYHRPESHSTTNDIIVHNSTFTNNIAGAGGGAFFTYLATSMTITDSVFIGNLAEYGGVFEAYDTDFLTVSGNWFCHNEATGHGGVAWSYGATAKDLWSNNVFVENTSPEGGALHLESNNHNQLINNTFVGNASRFGGTIYFESTTTTMTNNVVAWTEDDAAVTGMDSRREEDSAIDYNNWFENEDGVGSGTMETTFTSGAGTIEVDPEFVDYTNDGDCTNDDLTPATGSPLIDAGDPSLTDDDGSRSDIGAIVGVSPGPVDGDADGYSNFEDCDDDDAAIHPGASERCDGIDNNCDGAVDGSDSVDQSTWYRDSDGDGFGDFDDSRSACDQPEDFSSQPYDCDDRNYYANPDGTEVAYDGFDQDCDGNDLTDVDGDGYDSTEVTGGTDCEDTEATAYPGAAEVWYDGIDGDCGWDSDFDADGDGYDSDAHGGDDCDDFAADVHPGATEIEGDGVDSDCDGDGGPSGDGGTADGGTEDGGTSDGGAGDGGAGDGGTGDGGTGDGGTGDGGTSDGGGADGGSGSDTLEGGEGKGCSTAPSAPGVGALLWLVAVVGRRRKARRAHGLPGCSGYPGGLLP